MLASLVLLAFGWQKVVTPPAQLVGFTVAMTPSNLDKLDRLLHEVSDPDSDSYGKHWTGAQVAALTATDRNAVEKVLRALSPAACSPLGGDALRCTAAPDELEAIFQVRFEAWQDESKDSARLAIVASTPLRIPMAIRPHVVFIEGLTELPVRHRVRPLVSAEVGLLDDGHMVAPETILKTYNVSDGAEAPTVTQAVAEFIGNDLERQSDLTLFGAAVGLGNLTIDKVIGPPNDPSASSTEATLDIQYLASVGFPNKNVVWNQRDWMFALATSLATAKDTDRPSVVSVSYAWNEDRQCRGLPGAVNCSHTDNAGYINRTNVEFQKLGLLGTTVLVASGDSGAHGRTDETCLLKPRMHPDFPAASPFVTTVGGTQFSGSVTTSTDAPICKEAQARPCAGDGHEVVASNDRSVKTPSERARIVSGGGFSNYSPRPDYQRDAVSAYLKQHADAVPSAHLFNSEGRGYPDISALSHAYFIIMNNNTGYVDGTSAATPVIAGLVARLNAHRKAAGRPMVGFLNPLLYKIFAAAPSAFNDVTEGNNRCTETGCLCRTGFGAAAGWDAASGLGTPNFGRLVEAVDAMDAAREERKQRASA